MVAAFAVVDVTDGEWYCVDDEYFFLCIDETQEKTEKRAKKVQFLDEDGKEIPHVLKFVEFELGKTTRALIGRTHYYE